MLVQLHEDDFQSKVHIII